MADRPILFSAPMIKALLAGTKTQTRRILKPQPHLMSDTALSYIGDDCNGHEIRIRTGDRLWVRETWSGDFGWHDIKPSERHPSRNIWFWADGNPKEGDWERPRPGIHMPRWASRMTLLVDDVKVERLQDISEEDAIAEGATSRPKSHLCNKTGDEVPGWMMDWSRVDNGDDLDIDKSLSTASSAFVNFFWKLHDYPKHYGDEPAKWPNPWLACYIFRTILENIDHIGSAAA